MWKKKLTSYHVMMMVVIIVRVKITGKQRIPSWQITPHV